MAYNENTWQDGDVITAAGMNNMEGGIKANDTAIAALAADVAESAAMSGNNIVFKNGSGTTLFSVALPLYNGGVS